MAGDLVSLAAAAFLCPKWIVRRRYGRVLLGRRSYLAFCLEELGILLGVTSQDGGLASL